MTNKPALHEPILKPATQVTLLSLTNVVAGFLVQLLLAAKFGAASEMDSFLAATTVPTTLSAILLGSLNITFIPVFTQYRTNQGKAEAWKLASTFATAFMLLLSGLTVIGMFLSPAIIRLTTPGFAPDSQVFRAAVQMSWIMYPTIFFTGIAALLAAIAYAEKQFMLPASAPVINNVCLLVGTWVLYPQMGIYSVAWATLAGGIAQFLLLLPVALGPRRFRFCLDWHHPGIQKTVRVMLPLLLGGIIFRSNVVADRWVASTLPAGSIAHLGYGMKILNILWAITSSGVVLSIFPLQSEQARDPAELGRITAVGIRFSLILSLAIGSCFLLLRYPLIQLFFERGAFTTNDTTAVSTVMLFYAIAYYTPTTLGSVTYALYALQKTAVVTLVAVTGAICHFLLLIPFSAWGVNGVAFAFSLASLWNALAVCWLLIRRFQVPIDRGVWVCLAKTGLAAALAVLLVSAMQQWWNNLGVTSPGWNGVWLLSAVLSFVVVYLALLFIFQVEEVWLIWGKVRARWQPLLLP